MIRALALALAATALPAPARAADAPPAPWAGVWQGTVGTLPVRVCLADASADWQHGSYYYLSKLTPIPLSRETDGGWSEDAAKSPGPRWTVAVGADGRLTGQWHQGARTLPIALERVGSTADQDDACGSRAFVAPRLRPVSLSRKPKVFHGFAYQEVSYAVPPSFADVSLSSMAYPPSQPGDRAINAALVLDPDKPDGPADWLGCMEGALASNGRDGEFNLGYEPKAVTARWLTVQQATGGYCGGAHPDYGYSWVSFDRQSGKRIPLARWFGPGGSDADESNTIELPKGLRTLAVRRMKIADKDCRESVAEADFWSLGLGEKGLILTPSLPHVVQACIDDAVIPYPLVRPWLTPAGKAAVARLGLR